MKTASGLNTVIYSKVPKMMLRSLKKKNSISVSSIGNVGAREHLTASQLFSNLTKITKKKRNRKGQLSMCSGGNLSMCIGENLSIGVSIVGPSQLEQWCARHTGAYTLLNK